MGRFLECLHAQRQKMWTAYLATKLGSAGDKCIEIHHIHWLFGMCNIYDVMVRQYLTSPMIAGRISSVFFDVSKFIYSLSSDPLDLPPPQPGCQSPRGLVHMSRGSQLLNLHLQYICHDGILGGRSNWSPRPKKTEKKHNIHSWDGLSLGQALAEFLQVVCKNLRHPWTSQARPKFSWSAQSAHLWLVNLPPKPPNIPPP